MKTALILAFTVLASATAALSIVAFCAPEVFTPEMAAPGQIRQIVNGAPKWVTPTSDSPAIEAEKKYIRDRQIITKEVTLLAFDLGYSTGTRGLDREVARRQLEQIIDRRFADVFNPDKK